MMNKLTTLILISAVALVPSLARADKDFAGGTGATYDCGEDSTVNILHNGGTYVITGECTQINIEGNNVRLTVADVDQLSLNGTGNTVKAAEVGTILINGDNNSVRWSRAKSGRKPTVAANGNGNTITRNK